jgi:hypothetical protein
MVTEKTINKDAETCFRILDDDEVRLITTNTLSPFITYDMDRII